MGQKISYTVQIDGEIAALTAKLKEVRSAMDSALSSGKASGLDAVLKGLDRRLEQLKVKAQTPITSEAMFGRMLSDIANLKVGAEGLKSELQSLAKLSNDKKVNMVDAESLKRIQDSTTELKKLTDLYNKKITLVGKDLELQQAAAKAAADKAKAEKDAAAAERKISTAEAQKQELQGRTKALQQARELANQNKATAKAALDAAKDQAKVNEAEFQKQKKRVEEIENLYTSQGKGIKRPNVQTFNGQTYDLKAERERLELLRTNREASNANLEKATAEYSAQTEAVKAATDAVNKNAAAINSQDNAITTNTGKLKAVQAVIADSDGTIKAYTDRYDELQNQMRQPGIENAQKAFEKLGISLDGVDFSNPEQAMSLLETRINELVQQALAQLDERFRNAGAAADEFGNKASETAEQVKAGTEAFREQNDAAAEIRGLTSRIKQFTGLTGVALVMRRALRSAITTIKELDKQMTEMAVVTDLKVGDYWKQLPEHTAQANALGVAIKDVYEAETLYYQQGLKTAQVQKISISTLKMARIAGLSAEDATNKMTAALRGFNMEINETNADRIADVYSKLAAITASNVQEISTAMTKTASLASNAGMQFETTAALLSQIIETTRESAETAGTALKTVIARFQELKKAPEDIGEVDGEIVDANKIETALRSVGVALRDTQGQFRNLDEVFLELSSKWSTLDTNTQRYIATIAAGSRQQSRFIAMMSNYARTQELVNAANTAAGASNEQFEKTLDSLQSKLAQLKNAWDTFTQGLLNSSFLKGAVSFLTNLLTGLNAITKGWDAASGGALKFITVLAGLTVGRKIFSGLLGSLTKTISLFKEVNPKNFGQILTFFAKGNQKDKAGPLQSFAKLLSKENTRTIKVWFKDMKDGFRDVGSVLKPVRLQIGLLAAGIGVAVGVTIGLVKWFQAVKRNSPEGKLKAATDRARELASAAKDAGDQYKTLTDKMKAFKTASSGIKDMVKGSQQWRDSVKEINAQYLEMLDIYPKLATLQTTTRNGYIEFVNEADVNAVIREAEAEKITAEAAATFAKMEESRRKQDVRFSQLSDEAKVGSRSSANIGQNAASAVAGGLGGAAAGALIGSAIPVIGTAVGAIIGGAIGAIGGGVGSAASGAGEAAKNTAEMSQKKATDAFAKQLTETGYMAEEEIAKWLQDNGYVESEEAAKALAKEMYGAQDELAKYGATLTALEAEQAAYNESLRTSILGLVDETKYTTTAMAEMRGLLTDEFLAKIKESVDQDWDADTQKEFEKFITEKYSSDAKIKSGKIQYTDAEGKKQEVTVESGKQTFNSQRTVNEAARRAEKQQEGFAKILDQYSGTRTALHHAYKDTTGLNLTQADLLSLDKHSLAQVYQDNEALQEVYESFDEFYDEITRRTKEATTAFRENTKELQQLGLGDFSFVDGLTAGAQKGLVKSLAQVVSVSGIEGGQELGNAINNVLAHAAYGQREEIAAQLNAIDFRDADALEKLPETFAKLKLDVPIAALDTFIDTAKRTADAVHSINLDKLKESILALNQVAEGIRRGEQDRLFDSSTYETLIKQDASLINSFVQNIDGSFTYLGTSMEELVKTVRKSSDDLLLERGKLLQGQINARSVVDEMTKTGQAALSLDNMNMPMATLESRKNFIAEFQNRMNKEGFDFGKYFTYLSEETSINELTPEKIQTTIDELVKLRTIPELTEEMFNIDVALQVPQALTQDLLYNLQNELLTTAQTKGIASTDKDSIKNLRVDRRASWSQLKTFGVSDKDLEVLSYYDEYLNLMESVGATTTATYKNITKARNEYAKNLGTPANQRKLYDGQLETMKKNKELLESYKNTTSEIKKQQYVEQMYANLPIKITEKNYEAFAALQAKLLSGGEEGIAAYEQIIEFAGESVLGKTEDFYNKLEGKTGEEIKELFGKNGEEALKLADDFANKFQGYWDPDTGRFHFLQNMFDGLIDDLNGLADKDKWYSPYNWLYNANQEINAQLRERQRLEREWKYAIEDNSKSVNELADNLTQQFDLNKDLASEQEAIFNNAQQELRDYYEYINTKQDLAPLQDAFAVGSNGQIVVNKEKLYNAGVDADTGSVIETEIGKIEELLDTMRNAEDELYNINDRVRELQKTGKDQYNGLLDRVTEALRKTYQEQIDTMSAINDAITNAQEKLTDKIQEKIDDDRQAREEDKRRQQLTDKTTELAYLRASGANPLDILKAEKALAEEEESFTDSLVDKSLQELQDANQKAADQRQEQIDIAQAQFDWWSENDAIHEAETKLDASLVEIASGLDPEKTKIAELLAKTENVAAQSKDNAEEWWKNFSAESNQAVIWQAFKGKGAITTINDSLETLSDHSVYQSQSVAQSAKIVSDAFANMKVGETTGLLHNGEFLEYKKPEKDDFWATTQKWNDMLNKISGVLGIDVSKSDSTGSIDGALRNSQLIQHIQGWIEKFKARYPKSGTEGDDNGGDDKDPPQTPPINGSGSLEDAMLYHKQRTARYRAEEQSANSLPWFEGEFKDMIVFPYTVTGNYSTNGPIWATEAAQSLPNQTVFAMKEEDGYHAYQVLDYGNGTKVAMIFEPREGLAEIIKQWYAKKGLRVSHNDIPIASYATGGLADFTGPAWLDGTHSNPELVLNQTDTANFIELKNVLSEIIKNGSISSGMGNNYYDIDVHVDSIDSDYDVDSAANRIKELIVDDAMYRNVNAVQQIR